MTDMCRQYLIITTLCFGVIYMYPDPARSPKIYNALISSDENLQPSHAYPLVEPVLRTTALGVAFPPLIVPQVPQQIVDAQQPLDYGDYKLQPIEPLEQMILETPASVISAQVGPRINHYGSLYPLAYETAYVPHANGLRLPVPQPVPYYPPYDQHAQLPPFYLNHLMQQQQQQDQQNVQNVTTKEQQKQQQQTLSESQEAVKKLPVSPQVPYYPSPLSAPGFGVNFQKNPDIPDVPPPPLPVSNKRRQ